MPSSVGDRNRDGAAKPGLDNTISKPIEPGIKTDDSRRISFANVAQAQDSKKPDAGNNIQNV